jgi:ParB/RepB/Spo0J family partition protein
VTLANIPLAEIRESSTNPRKTFDAAQLDELVASVRQFGVLQPILVRPAPYYHSGDTALATSYELVAGARRLRAAAAAGLAEIPATVVELDDRQALEVQVVENLQRQDLGVLEEARGFELLHREHGYEVAALAAKVGKSTSYVYGRLQLVRLPAKAQKLIEEGRLTAAHALLLARIPSPELAAKAAEEMAGRMGAGAMSIAEARGLLVRSYMLRLASAPFDTTDGTLVPAAGPCGACPKRTGCQRGLFADDVEDDDLCTDRACFDAKTVAGYTRARQQAEREGVQVLPKSKSQSFEFVNLEDVCFDDPKQRTYRQLLGGRKGVAGVEGRVLAQSIAGGAEWRFPRKKLRAALKAAGHYFGQDAAKAKAATRQQGKDAAELVSPRELNEAVRQRVVQHIGKGGGTVVDVLRALVDCQAGQWFTEGDDVVERWGAKRPSPSGRFDWQTHQRSEAVLLAMLVDMVLDHRDPDRLAHFAEVCGIDRAKVEKELRAEAAAKAEKAKAKPPKPTTKRPKAAKGKAAAAGGERDA